MPLILKEICFSGKHCENVFVSLGQVTQMQESNFIVKRYGESGLWVCIKTAPLFECPGIVTIEE